MVLVRSWGFELMTFPARPSGRLVVDTEGLSGDLAGVRRSGREVTGIGHAS